MFQNFTFCEEGSLIMSKLVAFICDECHTVSKRGHGHGWITLYAQLDPNKNKNTTMHLCPNCARNLMFKLWDNPEEVSRRNKALLEQRLKSIE